MKEINPEKFVSVAEICQLSMPPEIAVIIDDEIVPELVIASVANHRFEVPKDAWERFCLAVEQEDANLFKAYLEGRQGVRYTPMFHEEGEEVHYINPLLTKPELTQEMTQLIMARVSGVIAGTIPIVNRLGAICNHAIVDVANNGEIIKDKDAMLSFDVDLKQEIFKLVPCLDYIDPVMEEETSVQIHRTPMTKEQLELYFPNKEIREKFLSLIADANGYINNLYQSKLIKNSQAVKRVTSGLIESTIVSTFMDLQVKLVSFGGRDNWGLFGDLTPNSKACHEILDREVEYLVDYLKNKVVLDDGVTPEREIDVYSVDLERFDIYGRDVNNTVVTPPLVAASAHFHLRYSEGFMELFKLRLRQNDSRHCFFA